MADMFRIVNIPHRFHEKVPAIRIFWSAKSECVGMCVCLFYLHGCFVAFDLATAQQECVKVVISKDAPPH